MSPPTEISHYERILDFLNGFPPFGLSDRYIVTVRKVREGDRTAKFVTVRDKSQGGKKRCVYAQVIIENFVNVFSKVFYTYLYPLSTPEILCE